MLGCVTLENALFVGLAAPIEIPLYVYYTYLLCLLFVMGEGV